MQQQSSDGSFFDMYLSRFLLRLSGLKGEKRKLFSVLIERLSAALDEGHSCVTLSKKELFTQDLPATLCLTIDEYLAGDRAPLVCNHAKLFMYRYFHYEFRLARQLRAFSAGSHKLTKETRILLDTLFPGTEESGGAIDYQKEAAQLAITKNLAIISGGPGTGKTTTVVKILALLLAEAQYQGESLPRIALAAPTGRAAMRLGEAVANSIYRLGVDDQLKEAIPQTASTLHRLLGVRQGGGSIRHDHDTPLPYSVVVVDEASMVDLALMSKLVDAMPAGCRLILLGDKDQLASVESGAVLADLLRGLPDCGVQLQRSYRFDENIGALAAAVNNGEVPVAWDLLTSSSPENISVLSDDWLFWIGKRLSTYMRAVQRVINRKGSQQEEVIELFAVLRSFQVLCATRKGARGVEQINRELVRLLASMGFPCRGGDVWYPGRPVMVISNDYSLGLFNGDIGICLPVAAGEMRVWFERADGEVVGLLPARLPAHNTAFALTIHKSQGSEFTEVAVLLPEKVNRVLSRELLYTGITRAKERVWVLAEKEVFSVALTNRVVRQSGLRQLLAETKV